MPTYRILNQDGVVVDKDMEPIDISDEEALKVYKDMLTGAAPTVRLYIGRPN
jgi:2-oxoisovalerate dehydrogenase E1 component alpha subunit